MGLIAEQNRNQHYESILGTLSHGRRKVLEAISAAGSYGATRYELAKKLNLPVSSVCGRVNELEKERYVVETEAKRPTEHGGMATVVSLSSQFLAGNEPLKQLEMDFK